ncbi:hypothetical protein N9A86_00125 [Akkermansiaceae bacterium]|nr:hypothetical protein [Akkermansiaceae bacterium]MDB4536995.1 hypothetical protein [Akkermansiaceae bacterium]
MFSVSDLSEEQISEIRNWVSEGAQMADVQKRLESEFGHIVTYMDTRFLSLDLELEFHVEETPEPEEEEVESVQSASDESPAASGAVSVEIHQVAHPGSVISGSVRFSDGESGQWHITQEGQLSVDPDTTGYEPSEPDLMEFQEKLRAAVDQQP